MPQVSVPAHALAGLPKDIPKEEEEEEEKPYICMYMACVPLQVVNHTHFQEVEQAGYEYSALFPLTSLLDK